MLSRSLGRVTKYSYTNVYHPLLQELRRNGHLLAAIGHLHTKDVERRPQLAQALINSFPDEFCDGRRLALLQAIVDNSSQQIEGHGDDISAWIQAYCGRPVGVEFEHVSEGEERTWLYSQFESTEPEPLTKEQSRLLWQSKVHKYI